MQNITRYLASLATVLAVVATLGACKTTPINPDNFYQAVVTCAGDNSQSPQAGAAVLACLTGAVGGDYSACIAGLVTAGHWAVDEIACIVRSFATNAATRINAGTPSDTDATVLANANAWIREHQVKFRSVQ